MEESIMGEPRRENGQSNEIKLDAIGLESAPHKFREQIEAVYRLIGRYLGQTLKEFKMGFMRDSCPEHAVAIWCRIATAWYAYHEKFLEHNRLPDNQEKKIVAALVAISAGEEE